MIKIHAAGPTRSLRVIWQCEEMGLPYKVVTQTLPASASYRALNPMGALPFLEDDGGVAINESVAMMLYLAEQYGPTPLLPRKGDPALATTLQMLVFGEATMGMWANPIIMTRFNAPDGQKNNWTTDAARSRMEAAFQFASDKLGAAPFIAGNTFTLADISVDYVIGIAPFALGEAHTLPKNLLAYHERLQQRPAYQRALNAK